MAPSDRLHVSFASQPESAQRKFQGNVPKHVRFVDYAKLQIIYIHTIQLWVSLCNFACMYISYLYLQLSLDFTHTFHRDRQSYSL